MIKEKIKFEKLEEISLEGIGVLSGDNGESNKGSQTANLNSYNYKKHSKIKFSNIFSFSCFRNDYTRMAL